MSVAGAIATLERVQPGALVRKQELNLDWHAPNGSKPGARHRSAEGMVEIALFEGVQTRRDGPKKGLV